MPKKVQQTIIPPFLKTHDYLASTKGYDHDQIKGSKFHKDEPLEIKDMKLSQMYTQMNQKEVIDKLTSFAPIKGPEAFSAKAAAVN